MITYSFVCVLFFFFNIVLKAVYVKVLFWSYACLLREEISYNPVHVSNKRGCCVQSRFQGMPSEYQAVTLNNSHQWTRANWRFNQRPHIKSSLWYHLCQNLEATFCCNLFVTFALRFQFKIRHTKCPIFFYDILGPTIFGNNGRDKVRIITGNKTAMCSLPGVLNC